MTERSEAKPRGQWRLLITPKHWRGGLLAQRAIYTNKTELSPHASNHLTSRIAELLSGGATIVYVDNNNYRFLDGNKNTLIVLPRKHQHFPLNFKRDLVVVEGKPTLNINARLNTSKVTINVSCGDHFSTQHFSKEIPNEPPTIYAVIKDQNTSRHYAMMLLTGYSETKFQRLRLTA